MQFADIPDPLIVILGPTAVGKTEIALHLAEHFDGEIVSADSRLFYKGMDIGTDKPSPEDRSRVPHHLIDVTTPDQAWSLALFQKEAQEVIRDIHLRKKIPFLVGGTGQYIRAITEGWDIPKQKPNRAMRFVLENWADQIGKKEMHRRLKTIDPDAAEKIDFENVRRTIRALEVIFLTGRKFSSQRSRQPRPYSLLQIGLTRPRPELYVRIDARIDKMISEGMVDEVKSLLRNGYTPDMPPMSAIGYREIIQYLDDEISLDEAVRRMKRRTREFVRRQANWFKPGDIHIHWFVAKDKVIDDIETFIRSGSGWLMKDET
jgi:tRNA dimethylallyltransferase